MLVQTSLYQTILMLN